MHAQSLFQVAVWSVFLSLACLAGPGAAADLDLVSQVRTTPRMETEDLCEPVKSVREGMLLWAPNPDGKTWDLLQIYFPQYGGPNTIVVIDLGSGAVKQIQTDRGWNFHLCPAVVAPNGKLFISALNPRLQQEICLYDPATNELTLGAVDVPDDILGETHPLVLGTDGKLYAVGQHPSRTATAAQIDPDSLQVKAYGPIGPSHEPNSCWGYSGAADERFIYIASGKIPWYLVAFDRQTGQSQVLVETETVGGNVSVGQRPDGCVGSASGLVNTGGERVDYWLYQGRAISKDKSEPTPPWPPRESRSNEPPRPEVNTGLAVPDVEGWAEIWVRTAQAKAAVPAGTPVDAAPEQLGWQRFRFQVPLYAHSIYRLTELADGRLFGTAGAYEGNFVYEPKTGRSKHLGKIQLSHYATAVSGGKVYMSGYPSSPLYVYDPQQPWTAGTFVNGRVIQDDQPEANPRMLLRMGEKKLAGTHKMYAAAMAAGGTVVFGGAWIRDGACGGIAWYDPQTGQVQGMWEPLSNYQVTHLAAVDEGRTVVISTRRVDDSVLGKPKPEQGALWFLDLEQGKLTGKFEPVALAKGTGPIVAAGGSRLVGWTENPQDGKASILYAVDVRGPTLVYRRDVPFALPVAIGSNQQEAWDFRRGPDGQIWTFVDNVLVRIAPEDGAVTVVGRPDRPGPLAFAEGRVYLGGTTAVRRIKEVR
ncbi:MAG: hypothetical protein MUE50_01900 [Pirellulaceae bacterium]|nr:hypothetical protein [Pirellulaceae bacterium]